MAEVLPISYPHLLPVLADHIWRPYHYRTREGIARALTVREARGTEIVYVLLNELKNLADPSDNHAKNYRWALVNALTLIGDASIADDVKKLFADARYADVKRDLKRLLKALGRKGR